MQQDEPPSSSPSPNIVVFNSFLMGKAEGFDEGEGRLVLGKERKTTIDGQNLDDMELFYWLLINIGFMGQSNKT